MYLIIVEIHIQSQFVSFLLSREILEKQLEKNHLIAHFCFPLFFFATIIMLGNNDNHNDIDETIQTESCTRKKRCGNQIDRIMTVQLKLFGSFSLDSLFLIEYRFLEQYGDSIF